MILNTWIECSISPFCGFSDKPKLSLYKTGSLSFIRLLIVHRGKIDFGVEGFSSSDFKVTKKNGLLPLNTVGFFHGKFAPYFKVRC